jgi:hypothetical protein
METSTNPAALRRTGGAHRGGKDHRSAVTNGRRLHVVRPGDTAWSRRFRDILHQIVGDLGGRDVLSEGQRQLARRCATIAITCEKMEGVAAAGEDIDLEQYGRLTDRLGRSFQRLGLKRQARDVALSFRDRLQLEAEATAAPEDVLVPEAADAAALTSNHANVTAVPSSEDLT